jgi:hypothetical protein
MRLDSTEYMMIIKKNRCLLQNGICPHSTQSDRMTEGILYCFGAAARARKRVVTISGLDGMVLGAEGQGEGTGGLIKVERFPEFLAREASMLYRGMSHQP